MTQNILEMRDIDKGFNGVPVLKHVNLMSAPRSPRPGAVKTVPASPHVFPCLLHGQYDGAIIFDGKKSDPPIKDLRPRHWHHPPGAGPSFPTCRSQNIFLGADSSASSA